MGKISDELEKLMAILDERGDLFVKRIDLARSGELGKVRFIDENIFPAILRKQNLQALKVTEAFHERLGDRYEREKNQTKIS